MAKASCELRSAYSRSKTLSSVSCIHQFNSGSRQKTDIYFTLRAWSAVFQELHRVLRPGGLVAFEVGEVRGGKLKLEEGVLPCGVAAGLRPELVLIHDQRFTKTSHCWGQENNAKGTNTNRIVLFRKEG